MNIFHELGGLFSRNDPDVSQPQAASRKLEIVNGLIAGIFFTVVLMAGSGNAWLSLNFGFGMFLAVGNVLRLDDEAIGLTAGLLGALCVSGIIGSFFGPEIGKVTALGLFAAVAPAVHLMDTEPGWGRGGRNFVAVCWAVAIMTIFLAWFFDNYSLRLIS